MDDKQYTHLLFIDDDIAFNPESVFRMLDLDEDVVTGVYPRKVIDWTKAIRRVKENPKIKEDELHAASLQYNLNVKDPKKVIVKKGFIEVLDGATGFMLIKKEVFDKMKEAYPNLQYTSDQIINNDRYSSKNCFAFFDCIIDEKSNRYLSEDYAFCRLWQKIGGKIHADLQSPLTHYGTYPFAGHVWTKFKIDEVIKNGNDVQQSSK